MADCQVRLSGSGGQGLILSAGFLAETLVGEGHAVAQSQSYEPTSRGGLSRSDLIISDSLADYPLVTALDWLVILDQCAVKASAGMIRDDAMVITDSRLVTAPPEGRFRLVALPVTEAASALGNKRVANLVALGALIELSGLCALEHLEDVVKARMLAALRGVNIKALECGRSLAAAARKNQIVPMELEHNPT